MISVVTVSVTEDVLQRATLFPNALHFAPVLLTCAAIVAISA